MWSTYLIIDALDECTTDLNLLLELYSHISWIVSSRNWLSIEERLNTVTQKLRLCLELNEKSVSVAVSIYNQHKVVVNIRKASCCEKTRGLSRTLNCEAGRIRQLFIQNPSVRLQT